ncbi:hypothetical protein SD66_08595 [Enterobacter cloacae]|nr:hypothetical protein SD66_08595 [Enterobacter cloacae]
MNSSFLKIAYSFIPEFLCCIALTISARRITNFVYTAGFILTPVINRLVMIEGLVEYKYSVQVISYSLQVLM